MINLLIRGVAESSQKFRNPAHPISLQYQCSKRRAQNLRNFKPGFTSYEAQKDQPHYLSIGIVRY